jgi:ubiquinone/menaquinone biosynthesis C-methylase UbiE
MKRSHIFDPEHIAVLEAENRKIWQNPDEILNVVELKPDFVAADLGCGSGYFTMPLARIVKKVYGIDVQREMLNFLEDKIRKRGIRNIDPLLSKPDEIPLGDRSVDLLMSVNTLHEFGDRNKMIDEMGRVLRTDGKLLIVDFKKEETGFGPPLRIRISKTRAVKLFEAKGFRLRKAKELPFHYVLVFVKD